MSWYGDPDALDASARMLTADADGVRARARRLVSAARDTQWRGPAAEAFRQSVQRDAQALDAAARELDEAAHELHSHAQEVRERLARLRALEDAVTGWIGDRIEELT